MRTPTGGHTTGLPHHVRRGVLLEPALRLGRIRGYMSATARTSKARKETVWEALRRRRFAALCQPRCDHQVDQRRHAEPSAGRSVVRSATDCLGPPVNRAEDLIRTSDEHADAVSGRATRRAQVATTLKDILERPGGRYDLQTMCEAAGAPRTSP